MSENTTTSSTNVDADAKASTSKVTDDGDDDKQPSSSSDGKEHSEGKFECNICLDTAKDAVISMCGHLFCWPCIHQWLETRPNRQTCPVCKSAISVDKLIPLYGRGGDQTDPRKKLPPRPAGQRSEPTGSAFPGFTWANAGNAWGFGGDGGGGGGVQFSFGIGAFPFTLFASTFNLGTPTPNDHRPHAPAPGSREYEEEQYISKLFMFIAAVFIVWLMLV